MVFAHGSGSSRLSPRNRTVAEALNAQGIATLLFVLALPRGGVPGAAEVATALEAPLDLILVRKISVPFQPELAMGAVVDSAEPVVVRNEDVVKLTGVSERDFNAIRDEQLAEIERRHKLYLGDRLHPTISGHTVIVVDDGIVCLEDYEEFGAIGFFYSDFKQVSNTEVIALLAAHPVKSPAAAG